MAEFINDTKMWHQMMMDMPFKAPGGRTAEEAATKPGNCVKSNERDPSSGGFPKYHGRLLSYGDECVVLGHNSPVSEPFIWKGTNQEYHQTWVVD